MVGRVSCGVGDGVLMRPIDLKVYCHISLHSSLGHPPTKPRTSHDPLLLPVLTSNLPILIFSCKHNHSLNLTILAINFPIINRPIYRYSEDFPDLILHKNGIMHTFMSIITAFLKITIRAIVLTE